MIFQFLEFIFYSVLIVLISKFLLVKTLRNLAEKLNLNSHTVGNIAGAATSSPELLTVCFSASAGLISTSFYNIISSNIINLIQYLFSIFLNKNQKYLKNKAIKVNLIIVLFTILIPVFMKFFNINLTITIVPIFILLFIIVIFINKNIHKLYLKKEDKLIYELNKKENKMNKKSFFSIIKYFIYLILIGFLLYFIGDKLSDVLSNLASHFHISELILGILLGFITSLPELITFIESQKHYKGESELGVLETTSNLLSSNILNLFIIQSLGILIYFIL